MMRIVSACLLALLLTPLAACDEDDGPSTAKDPARSPRLEFTQTGGCGDAFFWATTAGDDHAVVVTAELRDRSATRQTELSVDLPDPAVEVELWAGTGLTSLMCNDVVLGDVSKETPVTQGEVSITLQPRPEGSFDLVDGKAVLTDLVAEDGTELHDLQIKSTSIGFYAG